MVALDFVCQAAFQGDVDELKKLLDQKENMGYTGDINTHLTDMTPLMYAAMGGDEKAVNMLLAAGADPHVKTLMPGGDPKNGETAKAKAAKFGHDKVVKALEAAEKKYPVGKYRTHGIAANAKLAPGETEDPQPAPKAAKATPAAAPQRKATTIALMFPGQGSQYVKMMSEASKIPAVADMLKKANDILGYDLLELCMNGPEDKLEQTNYCQPSMYVAGLAGLEMLRSKKVEAVEAPGAIAGLSLGEYTALTAAGVFSFEDGLKLVKLRGEAMHEAAQQCPQLMLSVAGLERDKLEALCKEAAASEKGGVCQLANSLFPKGYACAGTKASVEKLKDLAEKAGAMQARMLKTGGAFHTSLMEPAQKKLEVALKETLPRMNSPKHIVYMNVTAEALQPGSDPKIITDLLARQLTSPVLWESSVRGMIKAGLNEFYEVGPMKQLTAMMKRIDPNMWKNTKPGEV